MAYHIENPCERLVLVRLLPPITANEAISFKTDLGKALDMIKGGSIVCTDLRHTDLFPPHLMNQYVELMRRVNGHFLRSVFWTSDSGLHSAQVERMVKEGNNASRKAMHTAAEIDNWLGEISSANEKRALHRYLIANVAVAKHA